MKLNIFCIFFMNYFALFFSLEVQLNVHDSNGTINNYTIINNSNSKNELFQAQKIFENNCQCNYNTDVFYVSPSKNKINFTINISEANTNDESPKIENPKLFINSQKIGAEYTLIKNDNENIYNLQINTFCNKEEENNNINKNYIKKKKKKKKKK